MVQNESNRSGLPGNQKNKENQPLLQHLKAPNRRDSLGRGILKNYNPQDDNNTVAVMQIPLRDSQQENARLLGGSRSYRRRVSFAPEVTLHKIDVIPHAGTQEQRQPRRRKTIAHFRPSSENSNDSLIGDPDTEFGVEEIVYDSTDVDMEDDSHVYSSPIKTNDLGFEIHQDQDKQREYTEPIDMSISRVLEDDDECTMDLTKPLGEIQLPQNISSLQTQGSQESVELEASQRPFGSIKSLFNDEDNELEEEVEMDLTQPFSKSQPEQAPAQTTPQRPDLSVEVSAGNSMELKSLGDNITDTITNKNTMLNKQMQSNNQYGNTQDISDGKTIDQTQMFGITNNTDIDNELMDATKSFNEIDMDKTKIYTSNQNDDLPNSTATALLKSKTTTPLKPTRSHTLETGSPISSKRKDKAASPNDLRERINSLTPRKKRKTSSNGFKESVLEPALPVAFQNSQQLSQDDIKPSFTPLRTSDHQKRASLLNSSRIDAGSFIEKAPLASSHEETEREEDFYKPRSLRKFLDDLSIEFFDDLNINDDFIFEIKPQPYESRAHDVDYTIAMNSKVPWLELYSFSCTELKKNMTELKCLFDNLNEEFADENPQLVREYYETQSLVQQKKLSDMLLMMKTYSDKEAEKSWCIWHEKLLDELLARLETNLELLKNDHSQLKESNEELIGDAKALKAEMELVTSELQSVSTQKATLSSDESKEMNMLKLKLMQELSSSDESKEMNMLKLELVQELNSLMEEKERFEVLEAEVQEIRSQRVDTTAIEMEIEEKSVYVEKNRQEPSLNLNMLLKEFEQLQSISGLKFEAFEAPKLHMSLHDSTINISLDLSNPTTKEFILSKTLPNLTKIVLKKYLAESSHHDFIQMLRNISNIIQNLEKFNKDIFYIGLVYPSVIDLNDGINVELIDFNKTQRYKAKLSFRITHEQFLSSLKPQEIKVKVIYGPQNIQPSTLLKNLKKKISSDHLLYSVESLTFF